MAAKQGMCKNCGSLVMFDDRDELCECVFCNCVFPSAEAAEILENPEGYEFKNETFEKQEGGKHYYSNPIMPDIVEKAVQRDKTSKAKKEDLKLKPNEFEISPSDVKAPKKLVIGMIAGCAAFVAIVLAIAFPMYFSRKALKDSITADIGKIFTTQVNGYRQYNIYGRTCQYVKLGVAEDLTEDDANTIYSNYAALRSEKRGENSGDIEMYIYTPDTVYFINKDGLTKDVQEHVEIVETSATEKKK